MGSAVKRREDGRPGETEDSAGAIPAALRLVGPMAEDHETVKERGQEHPEDQAQKGEHHRTSSPAPPALTPRALAGRESGDRSASAPFPGDLASASHHCLSVLPRSFAEKSP